MKEMLYAVRCLKVFKLLHFDHSGAITVIMDFARHKHENDH